MKCFYHWRCHFLVHIDLLECHYHHRHFPIRLCDEMMNVEVSSIVENQLDWMVGYYCHLVLLNILQQEKFV